MYMQLPFIYSYYYATSFILASLVVLLLLLLSAAQLPMTRNAAGRGAQVQERERGREIGTERGRGRGRSRGRGVYCCGGRSASVRKNFKCCQFPRHSLLSLFLSSPFLFPCLFDGFFSCLPKQKSQFVRIFFYYHYFYMYISTDTHTYTH